jgi:ATP-dependent Clp protease ATP-binding subunit ClpC
MYERFSDRARTVMQLANAEAQGHGSDYILPEHILLAMLREGTGVGVQVLKNARSCRFLPLFPRTLIF